MSACGLLCLPCAARISVDDTGFLNNTAHQISYLLSFDAGNRGSVDKRIVPAGLESALLITGITYLGAALTLIPNTGDPASGRNGGSWFLDNPFSGGAADIVVAGTALAFAHMRLGVASISGSAPGFVTANIAGAASVSLTCRRMPPENSPVSR